MLNQLSHLATQHPKKVLAFWVILLLLSLPFALKIEGVLSSDTGYIPHSEAKRLEELVAVKFQHQAAYDLILTAEANSSQSDLSVLVTELDSLIKHIEELPLVARVDTAATQKLIPDFEAKQRSSLALIQLATKDPDEIQAATKAINDLLPQEDLLSYHLTGGPAIDQELKRISKRDALRAEIIGLGISLIVLIFIFGALVAASLPLLVAMMTIVLSTAVLFFIGQFGPIASFAQIIVTLLGLATGIDYALLMVNRFREELATGLEPALAARRTTLSAGKAVAISGLTVLIALSALLIPPLGFIRSMGVASILVMFFSVAISVTALPASLTLLGKHINWLQLSRREPGTRTRAFWLTRAQRVMRRPWLYTILGIGILLFLSLPAWRMQMDISGIRGLTENTSIKQAQAVLEKLQVADLQRSIDILVQFGNEGFFHPSSVRAISSLTREIEGLESVSKVFSPTTAPGVPKLLLYQYYASQRSAVASPIQPLVETTVSEQADYALLRIFPNANLSPTSIERLSQELKRRASDLKLTALFGGSYLIDREWTKALYKSFPLAIAVVYLATFILLGLAFRSLIIPIKSILLNTLAVAAAFGVITAVFQFGWLAPLIGLNQGLGFVETSVPIFIFAIVFGLSMDYEVFLVSRIFEGHQRGLSDKEAVSHALSVTGSVISSGALIMIIVFVAFIFSHIVLIKTLSLGLSIAILLDATLIRSALVPAVMTLAGRWNWWLPRPFAKLAKRVNLGHD